MQRGVIVVTAGGTGGHLFPAFALAEELGQRGYVVDLMTDMRGENYGQDFPARQVVRVPAATLAGRSPLAVARTAFTLMRGIRAARKALKEIKPLAVAGFGGYPTFPPIFAASRLRLPTLLHEQNAVMGRANRLLAKKVTAIALSFPEVDKLPPEAQGKTRFTGNPVRRAVLALKDRPYQSAGLTAPFTLLVFGGSQGARFFSEVVPLALALLPDDLRRRLAVVQQCRPEDIEQVRATYANAGIHCELGTFFKNLPELMAMASLVIGRAGASTVSELSVLGRPSILVPLPHAVDNDQLANATMLEKAGGCVCIEQKELTPERLAERLTGVLTMPDTLVQAAAAARAVGRPEAVQELADMVEELAQTGLQ